MKITTPAPLHLPEHLREGSTSGHSADVLFVCLLTYSINLKRRSAKFKPERDGDGIVFVVQTGEGHPLLTFPLWRHKGLTPRTSVAHCAQSEASSGGKGSTLLISAQLGDRLAHRQPLSAHAARCESPPPPPPVKPCVSLYSWEMRARSGSTPLVMARKRKTWEWISRRSS